MIIFNFQIINKYNNIKALNNKTCNNSFKKKNQNLHIKNINKC